jgi:GNAT superfamily N-acetyltransferase
MTDSNTTLLKSSEIDRASKILARAFGGDPMFRYLGIEVKPGQSKVDTDILQWFCNFNLRNCQPYNHIYTTPGDLKGVAVWVPPGKSEMNTWQTLSMLFVLFYKCGWHRTKRSLSLFSTLNKRHQEDMTEPHWMLSLIGVEPTYQGEGIGSLLLQPIFKKADRKGLSCYLSTFSEQAVGFYQKHGFIILWHGELSDESPRIWTMKRKPQTVDILP